jgi:hypothetical protein
LKIRRVCIRRLIDDIADRDGLRLRRGEKEQQTVNPGSYGGVNTELIQTPAGLGKLSVCIQAGTASKENA